MKDDEARRVALALLARGLIKPGDAATFAGVSRQLVNKWLKTAKIDWKRMHYGVLRKHWNKEMRRGPKLVETTRPRSRK